MKQAEKQKSALTVRQFSEGLFDDNSEYLLHRTQRGREMSWNHRRHCATYLRTYILPYFDNTPLVDLRALEIEDFQTWLLKQPHHGNGSAPLSPSSCNKIVQALRLVIKWAIRQRVLEHDPFVGVESLATQPKRRGIFTMEEVKRMFSLGPEAWPDPAARLLNMLAAACGLRKGELQAIRRKCVQPVELPDRKQAAVLLIDASWERSGRLKTPKSGRSRLVPVPPTVYGDMLEILAASPWKKPEHFLFYSADPKKPMSHHKIDDDFARALRATGISEEERRRRNLSFHSWRHWSNSFLVNKGLPPLRVQQLIGHTSLKMTANYLHPGQDFSDVLAITGELFSEGRQ
jgi:integrase